MKLGLLVIGIAFLLLVLGIGLTMYFALTARDERRAAAKIILLNLTIGGLAVLILFAI